MSDYDDPSAEHHHGHDGGGGGGGGGSQGDRNQADVTLPDFDDDSRIATVESGHDRYAALLESDDGDNGNSELVDADEQGGVALNTEYLYANEVVHGELVAADNAEDVDIDHDGVWDLVYYGDPEVDPFAVA
jgi:hypothetical protein